VYLNEQRLNDALLPFLATALFGPERTDYWRHALDAAAEPERMAPAKERASGSKPRSPTSNAGLAASS